MTTNTERIEAARASTGVAVDLGKVLAWSNDRAWRAQALAEAFHEAYERLAPEFGYEMRAETRKFDLNTSNGRLMIAVCGGILDALATSASVPAPAVRDLLLRAGQVIAWQCFGECRAYDAFGATGPLPSASDVDSEIRAFLAAAQPQAAAPAAAGGPVGWFESPHGAFRANPNYRISWPAQTLSWQIPLYMPTAAGGELQGWHRDVAEVAVVAHGCHMVTNGPRPDKPSLEAIWCAVDKVLAASQQATVKESLTVAPHIDRCKATGAMRQAMTFASVDLGAIALKLAKESHYRHKAVEDVLKVQADLDAAMVAPQGEQP